MTPGQATDLLELDNVEVVYHHVATAVHDRLLTRPAAFLSLRQVKS